MDIKFRGRRPNGEWVYGALIPAEYSWWQVSSIANKNRRFEVEDLTVGRYTGYTDFFGSEIYEGDIVETIDPPKERRVICFGEYADVSEEERYHCGFYVRFFDSGRQTIYRKEFGFWIKNYRECRVIGNIHDNPEFMKEV